MAKLLEDIPAFPKASREVLESGYGIDTAESFYAHAAKDPEGLAAALKLRKAEVERLARLVEGHLAPGDAERLRGGAVKHPRGLIIDR